VVELCESRWQQHISIRRAVILQTSGERSYETDSHFPLDGCGGVSVAEALTPQMCGHARALTGRTQPSPPQTFMAGKYAENYGARAWSAPFVC
jgi:hypothetical protein